LIPTFEAALLDQFRDFFRAGMKIFLGKRKYLRPIKRCRASIGRFVKLVVLLRDGGWADTRVWALQMDLAYVSGLILSESDSSVEQLLALQ
jgi:hypothetical protein